MEKTKRQRTSVTEPLPPVTVTEPPPPEHHDNSDVRAEEYGKERLKKKLEERHRIRDALAVYLMPFENSEPPPPAGSSTADLVDYHKRMTAERKRIYYERQEIERLKEAPLAESQQRESRKRDAIEAREMKKYFKNNPLNKRSFKSDIESGRYSGIYVFSFGYAKLESCVYQDFIKSLNTVNFGKVYFGRNTALSRIVGLVSEAEFNPELKLGDKGYRGVKELLPGLHKIGSMLDADDVGLLLTNKTKDEVLSKFREYQECDFVKLGQTPMKPLVYAKDDVLPLPPGSSAVELCPKLKELGMPVELSDGCIKLTDTFSVCEDGVRVTENATKILELLDIKMFSYVLVPLGCWSASTKKSEYILWDRPKSM